MDTFASDLDARSVPADRLAPIKRLQELQSDAFSAATFRTGDDRWVIVYNPLHSPERTHE